MHEIPEAMRAKLFRLADEATRAIRSAKEIEGSPMRMVELLARSPIGDPPPEFDHACFAWSELDPTLDADFDLSEIASGLRVERAMLDRMAAILKGEIELEAVPDGGTMDPRRSGLPQVGGHPSRRIVVDKGPTPIPHERRRFCFRFGGRGDPVASWSRTIDILDENGRPSAEAIEIVRTWAAAIVELGESILQPDRPRFAKLLPGASPKAVAARESLLRAYPKGLTGEELVKAMRKLGAICTAQDLSGRVIPELRRLGAQVEHRRGAGYYLVPIERAK
jgi:hypothetical protein